MKPRLILNPAICSDFIPQGGEGREQILIGEDEVEALRLVDYLGKSQDEAALSMGVSRGTVWRCVDSGRRKLSAMVIEGRPLVVVRSDEPSSIERD